MKETSPPSLPARTRWRVIAGLLALGMAVAGSAAWLLFTSSGARFLLEIALEPMGGRVGAVDGSLAGTLSLASVDVDSPRLRLRAVRVAVDWSPARLLEGEVRIDSLHAATLDIETPPSESPVREPETLVLPIRLSVAQAGIDRLRVATMGKGDEGWVLRDLAVQVATDRSRWTVKSARALTPFGEATLAGTLGATAPFALDAKGELAGTRGTAAYRAAIAGSGTLAKIEASLTGGEGGLTGQGTASVEPFTAQPLRRLVARLEGVDLAAFAAAPATRLAVEADLVPGDGALLAGPVRIANGIAGPWDKGRLPVESAAANLRFAGDRVELSGATLRMAGGGSAQGGATWAGGKLDARVTVKDADLLALHTTLRATKLTGTVQAAVTESGQLFTVALADPRFEIAGEARIADDILTIARARLARGGAFAEGRGTLALSGERAFEVEARIERLDPSAFAKVPAGELNGTFVAKGSLGRQLAGEARLQLAKSRYAGLPAEGHVAIAGDSERIARADIDLSLGTNRLVAKGALGRAEDSFDLRATLAELAQLGRPFGFEIGGRLDVDAHFAGALASPSLRATLDAGNLRLASGLRIASLKGKLDIGAGESSVAIGDLALTGLARDGEQDVLVERASLTLKGTRAAHDIALEGATPDKSALRALLSGGLVAGTRAPMWRGRLESLETTGLTAVALAAPAPLVVSTERIELADATLAGEPGQARFELTRWTPEGLEARGSLRGVFVRSITQILGLQGRLGSTLVMAGEWNVRMGETIDGFLSLQRERGDVRVGEPRESLGLETLALRAEAKAGRILASMDLRGKQAGQWQGELSATVRRGAGGWEVSPPAPLAGSFSVDVPDLAWMAAWIGPEARAGGRLKGAGTLAGTARDPQWSGRLEATNLLIREPSLGAEVADGTIAIAFRDREARIERFVLSMPWRPEGDAARELASVKRPAAGEVTAEGALDLGTRKGEVRLRATAFPLTRLPTRFLAVSGEGQAQFDGRTTALAGDFTADAGWFGIPASAPPSLSDDVIVERGPKAPEEAREAEHLRLDLRIGLGDNVYFRGRGVATRLAGILRLAGDAGPNLRATGAIRAVGGTYDAYGRTLVLERGALNFIGPIDNPGVNILALRKGLPVEAGIEITGTVNRPRARLVSSPEVPDAEKLSWLVLGRGQGDVSAGDAALLVGAANALLGQDTLPASKIIGGLGIDDVRIGRDDGGNLGALPESTVAGKTGTASAAEVLTVGKRLTDDIYVSYRQGLADAEGSLRVAWQFTKSLQLILQAGNRPGLDAVYRFTLDDVPRLTP